MKRFVAMLLTICVLASTFGCDLPTSPRKRVTLYGNDGTVIKTWDADSASLIGNHCHFLCDGQTVDIAGTITVEIIEPGE